MEPSWHERDRHDTRGLSMSDVTVGQGEGDARRPDVGTSVSRASMSSRARTPSMALADQVYIKEQVDKYASEEDRLQRVAVLVHDAIHGRNMMHRMDPLALRIARLLANKVYLVVYSFALVVNMGLASFERPSTFRPFNGANDPLISDVTALTIEAVCVAIFGVDVALRYRYSGHDRFRRYHWAWVKLAFVLTAVASMTAYAVDNHSFRIHRIFRPIMAIAHFRNVQKIFGNMVATTPRVARVSVLLIFHVVFSGVLAFKLFGGIDQNSCDTSTPTWRFCSPFSKQCQDYFGHFGGSMNQLFILLTTANFPDVMMPAYDCYPAAAIFFVVFLSIGIFFIMNLILAVAYSLFQDKTREKTMETIVKRVDALDAAYDLLCERKVWSGDEAGVNFATFSDIMKRVRGSLRPWHVRLMFDVLDVEQSGTLSKHAWRELVHIVEVDIGKVYDKSTVEYMCGRRFRLPLYSFVRHRYFDRFFDVLVYMSGILVMVDFAETNGSKNDTRINDALNVMLAFFVVELVLKLWGLGTRTYFHDGFNCLDFVVVGASVVAIVAVPLGIVPADLAGQLSFIRTLRIVRALRALKGFGQIVRSFWNIIPTFARYVMVTFATFYMFSIIGMESFAGTITFSKVNGTVVYAPAALKGTAYQINNYWGNNFDNLTRSLVTLFELTIVNNWPIQMEGYVAATNRWAMVYFYCWFFAIVIVILNIITAFLIDDFTITRAQIADEAAGIFPEWMTRIREVAVRQNIPGHEKWDIRRPIHTINIYEQMFRDEIDEFLEAEGRAAPPHRESSVMDVGAGETEGPGAALLAHVGDANGAGGAAVAHGTINGGGAGEVDGDETPTELRRRLRRRSSTLAGDLHHGDHYIRVHDVAAPADGSAAPHMPPRGHLGTLSRMRVSVHAHRSGSMAMGTSPSTGEMAYRPPSVSRGPSMGHMASLGSHESMDRDGSGSPGAGGDGDGDREHPIGAAPSRASGT